MKLELGNKDGGLRLGSVLFGTPVKLEYHSDRRYIVTQHKHPNDEQMLLINLSAGQECWMCPKTTVFPCNGRYVEE